MLDNEYKLKRYGNCFVVPFTILTGMVGSDVSFRR